MSKHLDSERAGEATAPKPPPDPSVSLNKLARFFLYVGLVFTLIASVLSVIGTGAWVYGAGVALGLWIASLVCSLNDPETQDFYRSLGWPQR